MFIDAAADNCHVATTRARPDAALVAALARYPSANVGDAMGRFGLLRSEISALSDDSRCAGPAVPVLTREGDNLAVHRALDEVQPGDVLVVNGFGDGNRAIFGDILGEVCVRRGVAGVVIDGAVRDCLAIRRLGLPVWAVAVSPMGPTKDGPGVIGEPIACGGVVVSQGDVIVADADGVAVVPSGTVAQVLSRLTDIEGAEERLKQRIRST